VLDRLADAGTGGILAHAGVVLLLIALIYGFLSPDFGLNAQSLVLVVSLVVAVGFVTYFTEGSTSLLAVRRHRAKASVRLYGTAIVVAVVSVVASRLTGFEPGLLYGFVASSLILAPVALGRRDEAMLVLIPAIGLLAISVVAWLVLQPLRASVDLGAPAWALIDSILAMVTLAGLEGLFFTLIPLRFMDGAVIMQWSRLAWALVFGTVTFLWWQLLLNRDRAYAATFEQTNVQVVVVLLVAFMVTTGGLWSYFRFRTPPEELAA
jgi:hypothetical protein